MKEIKIPIPEGTKAIIFDLDGTLIDSMPLHFEGYQYALRPWAVHYPKATFHARAGLPSTDTMELICEDFRLKDFDVAVAMQRKRDYVNAHLSEILPIQPMFDLMKSQHGKLPMSIGTGSNRRTVDVIMELMDLNKYIEMVVTSDDVTNHKPSPDTFLQCAELMQINPSDCAVYEDGVMGIEAAETAGMKVIDVNQYL